MSTANDRRDAYSEKLRDPRWQKKRLEVMQRDEWTCQICGDSASTLNVHHRWYDRGVEPWDYGLEALVTLCERCHATESKGRKFVEDMLIEAMRRTLLHRDLLALVVVFSHLHEKASDYCEALMLLPDRKLIEAYKQHCDERAAGCCPIIEISPQEREVFERRRDALRTAINHLFLRADAP